MCTIFRMRDADVLSLKDERRRRQADDRDEAFDDYIARVYADPSVLNYYYRARPDEDTRVVNHRKHSYGEIDILKKTFTRAEINVLKKVKLIKRVLEEDDELPARWHHWPMLFMYIRPSDTARIKQQKRDNLQRCIDRRASCVRDDVYDRLQLDYIFKLQVLKAQFDYA